MKKMIPVAIFGSGFIALDLLSKIHRSPILECKVLFCRTITPYIKKMAKKYDVQIVDDMANGFNEYSEKYEALFDSTSALSHKKYSPIFHGLDKLIINLTPDKSGSLCIPILNMGSLIDRQIKYFNMVSCGGQAGIPIIHAISKVDNDIEYVELVSSMSAKSLGAGSRINIDEYIETTQDAINYFTCNEDLETKLLLNVNNSEPSVNMKVSIFSKMNLAKIDEIRASVIDVVNEIKKYVPNYKLSVEPWIDGDHIMTMIEVQGVGDFLPKFAGNLDIITCASVQAAEMFFEANNEN